MRVFRALCVCLCLACPSLALDREAFTVTKYDLEVRIEPELRRLGARGVLTVRNDSAHTQKAVALQISSSLSWRSIRIGGKAVQFVSQPYVSDIDHTGALSEAIVTFPAEIKSKESVDVEVGYEGAIILNAERLTRVGVPDAVARHSSWDQIGPSFTAVRGGGYVTWYPITTESADFSEGNSLFEVRDRWRARVANSDFHLGLTLVGGKLAGTQALICGKGEKGSATGSAENQELRVECDWKPLGTIAPMFAAADYRALSKPPLEVFSLDGHEAGAGTYMSALQPASDFVKGWFGAPKAPVRVADLADPHSAPFENGTLLMVSMAGEDSRLTGINLVHELVHSAFPAPRPWVYEGLAHFAEAVYRQTQGGRQAALDFLGLHRAAFLDAEKEVTSAKSPTAGQPLVSTFDETYYRSKAAYVWWMLRDLVGDEALKQAIAKYRAEDDKDPKYVERLVEAAAKRELGWFFEDWVYNDRGLPEFRVQSAHPWVTDKGIQFITVTIENLGNVGAEVPFTVSYAGGETTQRIEVRAKSTATTRVQLQGAPAEIHINDGSVPERELANHVYRFPQ